MPNKSTQVYPKPGPVGGALIREVIGFLRQQGLELPLTSHILIGVSGGIDSVALAHLLAHFGRRIVPVGQLTLLHVNHGWRGAESDEDELFVQNLGTRWDVPVVTRRLNSPSSSTQNSWEEEARIERKKIFAQVAKLLHGRVFTAHQADDLAETLLWRLFTGAASTHGGGITFQHGVEIRPFLKIRKSHLKEYLQEVGEIHREDSTNFSERFLRAKMRSRLMPELEKIFPRAIDHLVQLGLEAQKAAKTSEIGTLQQNSVPPYELLFRAAGLKTRRSHLETIIDKWAAKDKSSKEIHLPGGWRLTREHKKQKVLETRRVTAGKKNRQASEIISERWVLERRELKPKHGMLKKHSTVASPSN